MLKKIPITVSPYFWLLAVLIAMINGNSLSDMVFWVGIVFISVLVHEMGHAIVAILFKEHPRIALIATGGVTTYEGKRLKFWQNFLVTLAGPLFGLGLFVLSYGILRLQLSQNSLWIQFWGLLQSVNLFWSCVNLIPVLPLDGGQLLRIGLEAFWGMRGFRLSLWIGMGVAVALALLAFLVGQVFVGAFFFLFAFQSFDIWRNVRYMTNQDRKESNSVLLVSAEKALEEGRKEEAKTILEDLLHKDKKGMISVAATHLLAIIEKEGGNYSHAYQLLQKIEKKLPSSALCLFQELAFLEKDFKRAFDYASSCYQISPTVEVAIRNSKASAAIGQAKAAGGWLQAAVKMGYGDIDSLLEDPIFEKVRSDKAFITFLDNL